jgi:hypothetical protein
VLAVDTVNDEQIERVTPCGTQTRKRAHAFDRSRFHRIWHGILTRELTAGVSVSATVKLA